MKELDRALLEGRTELSVHSLKDLPMELPPGCPFWASPGGRTPGTSWCCLQEKPHWDRSKPLGAPASGGFYSCSGLYPEVEAALVRGNVQTRLRKLDEGQYGALVLAAAGLKRLGLEDRISRYFSTEEMVPAAGQGILAIQGRAGVDYGYLHGFFDPDAETCAKAERAFVRELNGGCSAPIGAYGLLQGDTLLLTGMFCREDGSGFSGGPPSRVRPGRRSSWEDPGRQMEG